MIKLSESLVTTISDMVKMHTRNSIKVEKSQIERFVATLLQLSNLSEYDINLEINGVLYPVAQYEVLPGFQKLIAPEKVSVEAGREFLNLKEDYIIPEGVTAFSPMEMMKFNDLICSALRIPFGKDRVSVTGAMNEVTLSSVLSRVVFADLCRSYESASAGLPIKLKHQFVESFVFSMPVEEYLTRLVRDIFISLTADRK